MSNVLNFDNAYRFLGGYFVAFCTAMAMLFGHPLMGLVFGLSIVGLVLNPERQIARAFDAISENPVRWALIVAAGGVFLGGIVFSIVEQDASLMDGWWWAFISMTTVGYGDLSPATPEVRMVAVLVIVAGVLATAILTAALAGRVADLRQAKRLSQAHRTDSLDDDFDLLEADFCARLQALKYAHLQQINGTAKLHRRTMIKERV